MTKATALTRKPVEHLTPILKFEDEAYVLLTPQLAGMAREELGATSAEHREVILGAMDFLLSGI
jgi:toxin CcdB